MKIMTIFGTRPEIIRLSPVLKVLDQHCEQITVLASKDINKALSDIFIRDIDVRTPDVNLDISTQNGGDVGAQIISKADEMFAQYKPDRVLVIGGSVSSLSSLAASRRQIPVFHMEAGNRSYVHHDSDEITRRTVDHASSVLLPSTNTSKDNLLREGIDPSRIFVTGNPIKEALDTFSSRIDSSDVMTGQSVRPFEYFLVTIDKPENIDDPQHIKDIFEALVAVGMKFGKRVLVSMHPNTKEKLVQHGLNPSSAKIQLLDPMNYFDFVKLEKNSLAVLTDSSTVQQECCIFGVPNITIRDHTDRPETIECGSSILSGAESEAIVHAVELAIAQPASWTPPAEYMVSNVSQTVSRILLGHIRS